MSGVVACVTAAVVLGNYGTRSAMGPVTRVTMSTVWEYAAFVANSLIFLLIGLRMDLGTITDNLGLVLIGFARRARRPRRHRVRVRAGLAARGPQAAAALAARARVGRAARHHRPGAGAQRAGHRERPADPAGAHVRRRAHVARAAGADHAGARAPPGPGRHARAPPPAAGNAPPCSTASWRRTRSSTGSRSPAPCRASSSGTWSGPSRSRRTCSSRGSTQSRKSRRRATKSGSPSAWRRSSRSGADGAAARGGARGRHVRGDRDEIDRRLALLADRLVCEPPEACDDPGGQ